MRPSTLFDLLALYVLVDDPKIQAPEFDYDIAVSFAGEDRAYVDDVVAELKTAGVRVFYDEDALADMWGANLTDFLQDIYNRRARFALIFVSQYYVSKKWTNHERQSAQDRALTQAAPYILPVRLDDSKLPGLHTSIAYIDARRFGLTELVELVLKKLARPPDAPTQAAQSKVMFNGRVPRNPQEIEVVLTDRPRGWEYILYAAFLLDENRKLDSKYRDHQIGYSRRTGPPLSHDQVLPEVRRRLSDLESMTTFLNRLLAEDVQDAAFGKPGEPGDPDRIQHTATRMCSTEDDLLDWAASVRAVAAPSSEAREVLDALARFADQPIEAIRDFIERYVTEVNTVHQRILDGQRINLSMTIRLDVPDGVSEQFSRATDRYEAKRSQ